MTWKRCKIGGKVVLITNRKLHMGFRLVSISVTLNDLERRNGRVVCVILPNSVALGHYYVKVVKIQRHTLQGKCSLKNLVFSGISLMAIFAGNHPSEDVKV